MRPVPASRGRKRTCGLQNARWISTRQDWRTGSSGSTWTSRTRSRRQTGRTVVVLWRNHIHHCMFIIQKKVCGFWNEVAENVLPHLWKIKDILHCLMKQHDQSYWSAPFLFKSRKLSEKAGPQFLCSHRFRKRPQKQTCDGIIEMSLLSFPMAILEHKTIKLKFMCISLFVVLHNYIFLLV